MSSLRFDNKTVIVTGAGGGLGKTYALWFAKRGANVVVNDLGGSFTGEGGASSRAADVVVDEIKKAGGKAVANYDSVNDAGDKVVETAIKAFGTVHIVINNAGILRDKSFTSMSDKDWDLVQAVHVRGAYKVSRAAWPYMRKQKEGKIIMTASAAGIYGNFGQTNYSAAKHSLITFGKTLAIEGAKYNIHVNTIAPIAASRMTETVMPPDLLAAVKPEYVAPFVGFLVHDSVKESGSLFEVGAGYIAKLRWERTKGAVLKTDDSFTPAAVAARWEEICDFSEPQYPNSITDNKYLEYLEAAKAIEGSNKQGEALDYSGKVAIVTGAGGGLGRAYALLLAKCGASVVVNDVGNPDGTVDEIKKAGGKAVADKHSVEDGDAVIKTALDSFGGLHILVNNAGILRDKSFAAMSDAEWDAVQAVHLRGTYKCSKAAWPIFRKQKFGRIINTCSAVGIYGNFGQANYSTAKSAIIGFTRALAVEGVKYNILSNVIAPNAGTNMTRTIWPEEMVQAFKPDFVAPIVVYLAHDSSEETGGLFEVSGGWVAKTRWQRAGGVGFSIKKTLEPEDIAKRFNEICNFDDGRATNPLTPAEALQQIIDNATSGEEEENSDEGDVLSKAKAAKVEGAKYSYGSKEVILYNLGLGAKRTELKYVYEGDDQFQVIPSFGVIPQFESQSGIPFDEFLENFNPMLLLHGEQYLQVHVKEIPTEGDFTVNAQVIDVVDKGKAATVVIRTETFDSSKKLIFTNEATLFIRGAGGFGGKTTTEDRGAATAANNPPKRAPDAVVESPTSPDQAALYRLSGDYNPLHISPDFASVGGFKDPILHGLASYGIATKAVLSKYPGQVKSIKVRFAGHVFPGETIKTEMWKEGNKVIFVSSIVERNAKALSAAAIEFAEEPLQKAKL